MVWAPRDLKIEVLQQKQCFFVFSSHAHMNYLLIHMLHRTAIYFPMRMFRSMLVHSSETTSFHTFCLYMSLQAAPESSSHACGLFPYELHVIHNILSLRSRRACTWWNVWSIGSFFDGMPYNFSCLFRAETDNMLK